MPLETLEAWCAPSFASQNTGSNGQVSLGELRLTYPSLLESWARSSRLSAALFLVPCSPGAQEAVGSAAPRC